MKGFQSAKEITYVYQQQKKTVKIKIDNKVIQVWIVF